MLQSPPVLQATAALYCVPLEFGMDRDLADRWGVAAPPAVVLLAPDGRVLERLTDDITTERLVTAIGTAQTTISSDNPKAAAP